VDCEINVFKRKRRILVIPRHKLAWSPHIWTLVSGLQIIFIIRQHFISLHVLLRLDQLSESLLLVRKESGLWSFLHPDIIIRHMGNFKALSKYKVGDGELVWRRTVKNYFFKVILYDFFRVTFMGGAKTFDKLVELCSFLWNFMYLSSYS